MEGKKVFVYDDAGHEVIQLLKSLDNKTVNFEKGHEIVKALKLVEAVGIDAEEVEVKKNVRDDEITVVYILRDVIIGD